MGNNQNTKNAEDIKLSNNDINILNKNWQEMLNQGLDILGVGLMTRIMIEHKEMKSMFRKRNTVGSDINENGEIINPNQVVKKHGEKVFNVIQTAMNSLDDLSKIYSDLNKIGYDHYQYGTRVEHFQVCRFFFYRNNSCSSYFTILFILIDNRRSFDKYIERCSKRKVQR
jgi:hypothetical protein